MTLATDREEIRELNARYAVAADEGAAEDWAALFTPDGTFVHPTAGEITGTVALEKFIVDVTRSLAGKRSFHLISNVVTDVDGERAESRCYLLRYVGDDLPALIAVAGYRDLLRKVDGRWLLHRRTAYVD